MAPNRRSVPTSLSLSDSSDPESWGSTTITTTNNNNNVNPSGGKVKTVITSGSNCEINGNGNHVNGHSTGHYVNAKMLNLNHHHQHLLLHHHHRNNNHINRIQVNVGSSTNCEESVKSINSVNVSSSSNQVTSISSSQSTGCSLNHNHNNHHHHQQNNHHHPHHHNRNESNNHSPWKNWPKIDLISSIDPFESTDSMISAFACVAHVINSDSANGEDQIDGDNEIIGINGENSELSNDNEEDDNGSYDSSNHPNSLESPENYRPIQKPQSLGYHHQINNQLNGKRSADRFNVKSDQVNTIKPSPPPLSSIPRPSHQPPPPPISSIVKPETSSSTLITTTNQITSPTSPPPPPPPSTSSVNPVPVTSIAIPITAKDHLYETIYPSNIRLTRDSKYFVDYQNYRSILNQPVEPVSLDLPVNSTSIRVNQSSNDNPSSQSTSTDLINSKEIQDMVRRANYSSSTFTGKNSYKQPGRLSTPSSSSTSTTNQSYNHNNQARSISYNQSQRVKPQSYNYHHPHHQHHLPSHTNSSSLYKSTLSSSSSSSLRSPPPPPPSSPSPQLTTTTTTNQIDHNQRTVKNVPENLPTAHHQSVSKSTAISSRPACLQFNKSSNNLPFDQVDGKPNHNANHHHVKPSTIENKITNSNLQSTEKDSNLTNNQIEKAEKLKPDQVYPNSISIPIISRANVRSTEEYATINKSRSINSMKSATLSPSSPVTRDQIKLLSQDDSLLSKQSLDSPMSLTSLSSSPSPTTSPSTSSIGNHLIESKSKLGKTIKSKEKQSPSSSSPLSASTTSSSSSRSFFSRFFSLTHVISRTFSVEKIDKHRSASDHRSTLIKSAVSTPALLSATNRSSYFNDLNGNHQFPSTRTLIADSSFANNGNQENLEPVSLSSTSGSKSLQTKSSSSFVRAFKNRLSLRRSRRKVKVKVDVTRTKSDPRSIKINRYEDDKMIPRQLVKEETIYGSIVATSGDYMKIVEIHRPQGKPFGFFVARGTVNNVKGIFISRIDANGEKAYQGLLEIGDRLIEIDDNDVTEASVIQVNQLMSNKTKLTLKIVPFSVIADSSKA